MADRRIPVVLVASSSTSLFVVQSTNLTRSSGRRVLFNWYRFAIRAIRVREERVLMFLDRAGSSPRWPSRGRTARAKPAHPFFYDIE